MRGDRPIPSMGNRRKPAGRVELERAGARATASNPLDLAQTSLPVRRLAASASIAVQTARIAIAMTIKMPARRSGSAKLSRVRAASTNQAASDASQRRSPSELRQSL